MTNRIFRALSYELSLWKYQHIRHAHIMRGKPPTTARTLQQRLEELNWKDPEISFKVDIGFSLPKLKKNPLIDRWTAQLKQQRKDLKFEKLSRTKQLLINLNVAKNDWLATDGPKHIYKIAEHYKVYDHLYGDAYFFPVLPLSIQYSIDAENLFAPVYTGNILKSCEAVDKPIIDYCSDSNSLWTLLMTTPDANFSDPNAEYCHWFIGNIPGSEIAKGEQLIDYLRPIPPKGIGYCRYIFVLYKQNKHLDYSNYRREQPCLNLNDRNWNTLDFYKKYQDYLTPAGLAFFQANWDLSLKDFYHNKLDMKSPVFQYDFPPPYIRPQEYYPKRRPFNIYMDKYRDPKQINKEFFLRKMAKVHPFEGPEPPLPFPCAVRPKTFVPSWLKTVRVKEGLKQGYVNEID
ncbi:large ribosomal subunit protein mL38 [Prorops nasuta]|uniref:large ribosomal subunit protein mL38 n=1 Tax=Prorops nasuta TaxID=863751 RepID=UPI0034D01DDC